MDDQRSYFEQAADVLQQAFKATNVGEQAALLEEALRLNRLAIAEEQAKLRAWATSPLAPDSGGEDQGA